MQINYTTAKSEICNDLIQIKVKCKVKSKSKQKMSTIEARLKDFRKKD